MHKINRAFAVSASCLFVLMVTAVGATAQRFRGLHRFDGDDGASPSATLVQGADGNLYGTTSYGGTGSSSCWSSSGCGTVFRVTPSGILTTLYSFCSRSGCTDGANPLGALVLGTDGNFYGTTVYGGIRGCAGDLGCGTIFRINLSGTLTTLYTFCSLGSCADGQSPYAGLIQATDGNFYGTTYEGGEYGYGTVFKITPNAVLITLHSFYPTVDGANPESWLVEGTDGNFYGTTYDGSREGHGIVFKMTPSGTLTVLHNFNAGSDGAEPVAGLVQASDGNFYGTTVFGGTGSGTIFEITPTGSLTTIYSFCSQTNCSDGGVSYGGLIQATDGNLYGTTLTGGTNDGGTIFKISTDGTLTTLYSFCAQTNCADGTNSNASPVQATTGILYGTTDGGGARSNDGTIFGLSEGLGAFVEALPSSGNIGTPVKILGNHLPGATSVTFNGTPATFTIVSPSLITTTVPAGATTGTVQVVTPGGTLSSNVPFRVIQ